MIPSPQLTQARVSKFLSLVDRSGGPDACWPWTASKRRKGYGRIRIGGPAFVASRVAYLIGFDVDPGSLLVLHRCDNPPCCNPAHLFLGTHQENMTDSVTKGRRAGVRADRCIRGHLKLGDRSVSTGTGWRCRECKRIRARANWPAQRARKKARRELARAAQTTNPRPAELVAANADSSPRTEAPTPGTRHR